MQRMSFSRNKVNQNVFFWMQAIFSKNWHVEKFLIQNLTLCIFSIQNLSRCIFFNPKSDAL